MPLSFDRRSVLLGATLVPLGRALAQADTGKFAAANAQLAALEQKHGGRLGIAVLDTGSGARLAIAQASASRCAAPSRFSLPRRSLNKSTTAS